MKNTMFGIIGCGNMGEAILRGALQSGALKPSKVTVFDKDICKKNAMRTRYGVKKAGNACELAACCATMLIAVKPQDSKELFGMIGRHCKAGSHIISVMAGVKISTIEKAIGKPIGVTRVMPNIAALAGEAISGLSSNARAKRSGAALAKKIFLGIGEVLEVREDRLDAVTAVSGSGPAYFYYFVEALIEAAMKQGFSLKESEKLAAHTFYGAAALMKTLAERPGSLRSKVTSKGGTTEKAVGVLDKSGLKNIIALAVSEARKRATELSR